MRLLAIMVICLVCFACEVTLEAPKELRTIHIICVVDGDSLQINVLESEQFTVNCADVADSLKIP